MVIAKIFGGLGNQLFQYAMARNVAERNGSQLKVDLSWFESPDVATRRIFGLNSFIIQLRNASEAEINRCLMLRKAFGRDIYETIVPFRYKKYIKTKEFQVFNEIYLRLGGDVYLDGYWADERFFCDIANIIRKEFKLSGGLSPNNSNYSSIIDETESVSVHIRRGDYVTSSQFSPIFNICDQSYYRRAIDLIADKITHPVFFIFSDDIEWARQNLNPKHKVVYVSGAEGKLPHEEMILMSRCKHNIIANSTFSWWGAWLNPNNKKIVIAPDKWVNIPGAYGDQIVPPTWAKIAV